MRLPRRQPRSVYRVYSEEDYLDATESFPDWEAPAVDEPAPVEEVSSVEEARSAEVAAAPAADARVTDVEASAPAAPTLRRFAVGAALAGAVALVGGAIATAVLSRGSTVRRGDVQRVVSEPSAATAQAPRAARSRVRGSSVPKRRSAHPRGLVAARQAKAHATSRARVASGPHSGATPVAADLGASATAQPASAGAVAPVAVAAPIAAAPVAAIAPESAAAREFAPSVQLSAEIEFGFERR